MSRRRGRYVAATLPRLLPRCSRYVATTSQRPSTPCSRYVAATVTPLCLLRRRHCCRYVAATASGRGRSAGPGVTSSVGEWAGGVHQHPCRAQRAVRKHQGQGCRSGCVPQPAPSRGPSGAMRATDPLQTRYRPATHLRPRALRMTANSHRCRGQTAAPSIRSGRWTLVGERSWWCRGGQSWALRPGVPPGVVRPRPKGESDGPVGPSVPDGALTSSRDVAHFALPHVAPWASPIPRCRPRRARRPRRDSPRVRRGGNGVSPRRGWQPRYRRRTRGGRGAAAKGRGNQRQGFRCGEGHPVPIMRFPPAGVVLR